MTFGGEHTLELLLLLLKVWRREILESPEKDPFNKFSTFYSVYNNRLFPKQLVLVYGNHNAADNYLLKNEHFA